MRQIEEAIRRKVLSELDVTHEANDEEVIACIDRQLKQESLNTHLTFRDRQRIEQDVFNSLRKLDVLQDILEDERVTEIMVNGAGHIFYEKDGRIFSSEKVFSTEEKLSDVIQQIVSEQNKIINTSVPIVDTRLKDGSRVNIVLPPIAIDGAAVSIRKFPKEPYTMDQLVTFGTLSEEVASFLKLLVECGYNIFISGGTGSGKTTFLNALSNFIPADNRVITLEDSAELKIEGVANLVRLETRNANMEGQLEVSMRDLIRSALRMRPDRIIVGECRGAEALDMLQAMNTGHDGSLSTGHANSAKDMINRLETMVLMGMELPVPAIRSQIAAGIDIIVHVSRMRDRTRKLIDISEVTGIKDGQVELTSLYHFAETGENGGKISGVWERTGKLTNVEKIQLAGRECFWASC